MTSTQRRKLRARAWLAVCLVLLTGAHYCFYRFSTDPLNSLALTRGLTFGCILWTSVLLGVVWFRQAWARYVLIAMICAGIGAFGISALVLANDVGQPMHQAMRMVICGLLLYATALVPLGGSRSLDRYVAPREAGGG